MVVRLLLQVVMVVTSQVVLVVVVLVGVLYSLYIMELQVIVEL